MHYITGLASSVRKGIKKLWGQFAGQIKVLKLWGRKLSGGQFTALCYRTPGLTSKLIIIGFSHLVKPFGRVAFL